MTDEVAIKSATEPSPAAPRRAAARRSAAPAVGGSASPWRGRVVLAVVCVVSLAAGVLGTRAYYKRSEAEVVASVNGRTIDKGEFYGRLEQTAGAAVLRKMVDDELTLQLAKQKGLLPTDAEVNARYDTESKKPGFQEALTRANQNPASYREALRVGMAQAAILNQGVTVSDDEARRYYEANIDPKNPQARFHAPEALQVAAIVTPSRDQCEKALSELHSGIPFATVAKKYSTDRTRDNGGLMPPIFRSRPGQSKVPDLEAAMFKLRIGDQLGPYQAAGLWWIVRCLDKRADTTRKYEDVKDDCRRAVALQKGIPANGKRVSDEVQQFRQKARLQAFWPRYKSVLTAQ